MLQQWVTWVRKKDGIVCNEFQEKSSRGVHYSGREGDGGGFNLWVQDIVHHSHRKVHHYGALGKTRGKDTGFVVPWHSEVPSLWRKQQGTSNRCNTVDRPMDMQVTRICSVVVYFMCVRFLLWMLVWVWGAWDIHMPDIFHLSWRCVRWDVPAMISEMGSAEGVETVRRGDTETKEDKVMCLRYDSLFTQTELPLRQ